ncbi:acetyltransferase [Herminiimonas sp. KBW02]|uniref:acetyltransferase n=1 Tax=Herminiimonas sp. KBW02 TaxID=2153363 RepID=UPI000F5A7611|nr:acetyltransferase [Herminiimonas sp. KBW02]RQO34026.1 acetyltransferase [Herminiimonas sp. KBW02]
MSTYPDQHLSTVEVGEFALLTEIWEQSVRATHDFLSEADIQDLKPKVLNDYLPLMALRAYRDDDGNLQGFIGALNGKIEMLFIAPDSRGRGIGKALVRYAVDIMGAHALDVNEQNPQALGFYQRMGFQVTGRSAADGQGHPFPLLHMTLATAPA